MYVQVCTVYILDSPVTQNFQDLTTPSSTLPNQIIIAFFRKPRILGFKDQASLEQVSLLTLCSIR